MQQSTLACKEIKHSSEPLAKQIDSFTIIPIFFGDESGIIVPPLPINRIQVPPLVVLNGGPLLHRSTDQRRAQRIFFSLGLVYPVGYLGPGERQDRTGHQDRPTLCTSLQRI
ncbi:unnamed protein product [Rotaria magnacalcarata]|uniref:Uncharacterized protein n=1 Tax=Rotaria magnacalcarata TaxID=392030 RepID=A0A816MXK9_9BILA|nr:unnamed protein product [Rotaria magnacalcarata]